jgi:hypothetical protein
LKPAGIAGTSSGSAEFVLQFGQGAPALAFQAMKKALLPT